MPNDTSIDTSSLLTILGLIAAVWAIVPTATRLRFRLSVTWFDWLIVVGVFLAVHYLVFEPALRSVGLYYSFGPWKWGLDKSSSIYLLLLGLGLFILVRARAPKLARRNIGVFAKLVDNLLLTKRYDELVSLVEPQFSKLIGISRYRPLLARAAAKMAPRPAFDLEAILSGVRPKYENHLKRWFRSALNRLESTLAGWDSSAEQAQELLRGLSNSPSLVTHLAVAYPDFGLRILERPEVVREDFVELFMNALLSDNSSRLYVELKSNENLNGRHRLALPPTNRVLCFFFRDVSVAAHHGLYRAIGEPVLRRLDEDPKLVEAYNRSLGYFAEVGKYHSPVYAGIKLFEIMIHEGIHQGQQDHLWLFYFTHFTDGILEHMRDVAPDDGNHEFPTPFHYLLYQIVSVASNWVDDCLEVDVAAIAKDVTEKPDFDAYYIPEKATDALGTIVQSIISSPKIDDRFKHYMLEVSLSRYKRIKNTPRVAAVAQSFIKSLIYGLDLPTEPGYRHELHRVFGQLDHVLRHEIPEFAQALEDAQQ